MRDLELSHLIGRARLLRREGKTYNEIRALIGPVDDDTLRAWLRGIPRPPETNRTGRAKPEARRKARQLRAQGMTYAEIGRLTGASIGSLNLWLRDMPLDHFAPSERKARRFQESCARTRELRMAEREASIASIAAEFGVPSARDLFIAGLALYWAEGAKSKPWRVSDRVRLINSDVTVICLFLEWLDMVGVKREQIRARVSIHESADVHAAERHWSEVTGISAAQFCRATLKRHNPKTPRYNTGEDYFGCLTIDVCKSRELYRSIEGWWRGIAQAAQPSRNV